MRRQSGHHIAWDFCISQSDQQTKVNFQQESEPWAAVNVFLTDDEENVLLGDNEYICRFGNFIHDGVSLYYSGKKEQMKERLDGKQGDFVLSL